MIEIRNMTTSYGRGELFRVAGLTLKTGEITAVIGRNGSGKSTLLKTLAGFLKYQGSITIRGRECRDYSARERAREIAWLPQMLKTVQMDVETLAEHGRYPHHGSTRRMGDADREKVKEALRMTGMENMAKRSLQELSGGERQRAYLAMVIAQDTPMILLDEPTTYMDLVYQKTFFEILQHLKQSGRGIVLSVHHLEQCFAFCDSICLMDQRTLVRKATPEEWAKDTDTLRAVFGIEMKKTEDRELMYPYMIRR